MAAMQYSFLSGACGQFAAINAQQYGFSSSNQRTKNWWSFLRRGRSSWWIHFLKDQVEIGTIDTSDDLQMGMWEVLFFRFAPTRFSTKWRIHQNTRYAWRSRFDTVAGLPNELYYLPNNFGGGEFLQNVSIEQMNGMHDYCEQPKGINYQEYFGHARSQERILRTFNLERSTKSLHASSYWGTQWNQCLKLQRRFNFFATFLL